MLKRKGVFLAFEGIDGAGKTQLISSVSIVLIQKYNLEVKVCGSDNDPTISFLLQTIRTWSPSPIFTIALAKMVNNSINDERNIKPTLQNGGVVLVDRYLLSLLAYNIVLGLDKGWCESLVSCLTYPDKIVLLDITPEQALQRTKDNDPLSTNFGEGFLSFQTRVREQYLLLSKEHNCAVLDSTRPLPELVNHIVGIVREQMRV